MIRNKDTAIYKAMDGNSVDNGSKSHKTKGKKKKYTMHLSHLVPSH